MPSCGQTGTPRQLGSLPAGETRCGIQKKGDYLTSYIKAPEVKRQVSVLPVLIQMRSTHKRRSWATLSGLVIKTQDHRNHEHSLPPTHGLHWQLTTSSRRYCIIKTSLMSSHKDQYPFVKCNPLLCQLLHTSSPHGHNIGATYVANNISRSGEFTMQSSSYVLGKPPTTTTNIRSSSPSQYLSHTL